VGAYVWGPRTVILVLTRLGCLGAARLLARLGRNLCRRRRTLSRPGASARAARVRPRARSLLKTKL
jgi:hypothetical protein